MWKKICAIAGTVLAAIVAAILCRGLSNRRGVSGASGNLRKAVDHAKRAGDANRAATDAIDNGKRTAGEIAESNRDARFDVDRAKAILAAAKRRADKKRNPDGST